MKSYPSIPSTPVIGQHVWAFDKIDGSQIRAEWSSKRGFYKLGSRRRLVGETGVLAAARALLDAVFARPLSTIFLAEGYERAVCFFEYAGPKSFAGSHEPGDEMGLFLIDVAPYKRDLLLPREFLRLFGDLPIPELVYTGLVTEEFIEGIRSSTTLREGVVCKGAHKGQPQMFKVKTSDWISRVKAMYSHDPAKLQELL